MIRGRAGLRTHVVIRRRAIAALIACGLLLAACGGNQDDDRASAPATGQAAPQQEPAPGPEPDRRNLLLPPVGVPTRGTGAADPADVGVVRRWSQTLRAGDISGASRLWAAPAVGQNGTPVLRLRSRRDVMAFNAGLTCGAVVVAARGAGAYTIVKFRLENRKGPGAMDCSQIRGATARSAIRVRGGRIVEWYRLPDSPRGSAPGDPPVVDAPIV